VAEGLKTVQAPVDPVYRVGRAPDPFALPDWAYAQPDGTFGGRFDDPSGRRGVPPEQRFRTLYLSTTPSGAFGEVLARFRPDLAVLAALGSAPPGAGAVPTDWHAVRRLGVTILDATTSFVDIGAAHTLKILRPILAPLATELGLPDIDLSAVTGPSRVFTQEAARYVYEQRDDAGQPCYAGIRYTSRLDHSWECWAAFGDRVRHRVVRVDSTTASDAGLRAAAQVLGLAVTPVTSR
jgi:hypothetical protein